MNKLKMAVIGVGSMGKNHARVISELDNAWLSAVVDCDSEIGKAIADKHNCRYFSSLEELIKVDKPEAVCICVPTTLHLPLGKICLENGIEVLMEKPIAANVIEGEELINLANKHSRKLMIGHIERFNPTFIKVKEIVDSGELGKIIAVHTRRVGTYPPRIKDVNIAVDLAIHDIDLVNYLIGEIPSKISADKRRNHLKYREDSVEIFLQYSNSSAFIQANWVTPIRVRNMVVTGTAGYLEMDFLNQKINFYKNQFEIKLEEEGNPNSENIINFTEPQIVDVKIEKFESLKKEITTFIDIIKNKQPTSATHALEALKIALAC